MKKLLFFITLLICASAAEKDLYIFQTTDIHGESSNFLRVSTAIKQYREKYGADKLLLVDSGDTTQGTLDAYLTLGKITLDMMNAMKYDAWVPGNHDIEFGTEQFIKNLAMCKFPVLNGNLSLKNKFLPSYKIIDKSGVKIALIGMNTSWLSKWYWGKRYKNYQVIKVEDALVKVMPDILKQKPDIIVLAIHQGYVFQNSPSSRVKDISNRFPEIDIILGGHSHQKIAGKNLWSGSFYAQAGEYAKEFIFMKLKIDTVKKRLIHCESVLLPSSKFKKDAELEKKLAKEFQMIRDIKKKLIHKFDEPKLIAAIPGVDCPIQSLICQSIKWKTSANAVLYNRMQRELNGHFTENELFKAIPYENYLVTLTVNRSELAEIVKEQFLKNSFANYGLYGIKFDIDLKKKLFSPQMKPDETITLALSTFLAASGGGRFSFLAKLCDERAKEFDFNIRDVLREFLLTKPKIHPAKLWYNMKSPGIKKAPR
ncbi:MAG: bifunctional metallophosphatase/5'-nucleotidase [Lentisphaeria bacterium]|nr:metallophosphoesterase [Lentisphaeria bacterium]NQZ69404.1 bifunctional metallophosphatase/5'-nucleotidase [Lentisphaeria bacterium]